MRLLYVALTRAQDKLILTVPAEQRPRLAKPFAKAAAFLAAGAGATLHRQANSFADWLRAALLVHPGRRAAAAAGRQTWNCSLCLRRAESAVSDIKMCRRMPCKLSGPEPDAATPDVAPATDPALVDEAAGRALRGSTRRQRWHSCARQGQRDQHRAQSRADHAGTPWLSFPEDGLTAAEMGTALHAFLEHADFVRPLQLHKAAGGLDEAILAERERQVDSAA